MFRCFLLVKKSEPCLYACKSYTMVQWPRNYTVLWSVYVVGGCFKLPHLAPLIRGPGWVRLHTCGALANKGKLVNLNQQNRPRGALRCQDPPADLPAQTLSNSAVNRFSQTASCVLGGGGGDQQRALLEACGKRPLLHLVALFGLSVFALCVLINKQWACASRLKYSSIC